LLILPLGESERMALTPSQRVHPHLAAEWIAGEVPFPTEAKRFRNVEAWDANAGPMRLFATLRQAEREVDRAWPRRGLAPQPYRSAEKRDAALIRLAQHRQAMTDTGLQVPELPEDYAKRLAEMDVI
jgi:hypothetical protein